VIRICTSILCILAAPALLAAQEKYTIKLKHSGAGDVSLHAREQTKAETVVVTGPDGNVLQEKKQTTVEVNKYQEEIIEATAGKRPTKAKRIYSEATKKTDDATEKRSYHGQTVAIEKKDDGYHFSIDGKELTGEEAGDLPQAFDPKKPGDQELEQLLVPGKPVAVGESWNIDSKNLTKLLGEDEKAAKSLDLAKTKGTGKLVKAYKKDGRQFGILQYRIEVPVKALEGEHPCRDGAKLVLSIDVDSCIDGSVDADSGTFKMDISGTADHVQDGKKSGITIKFDVHSVEKGSTEPAKK
jgi:hypothetical protein